MEPRIDPKYQLFDFGFRPRPGDPKVWSRAPFLWFFYICGSILEVFFDTFSTKCRFFQCCFFYVFKITEKTDLWWILMKKVPSAEVFWKLSGVKAKSGKEVFCVHRTPYIELWRTLSRSFLDDFSAPAFQEGPGTHFLWFSVFFRAPGDTRIEK